LERAQIIFVTGIGTGIGKTVVSAVLTEALEADYWKPIQSGLDGQTDTETVRNLVSNAHTRFWKEAFSLQTPASPHLSARIDNVQITLDDLVESFRAQHDPSRPVVIEGAGGLMVPINARDFLYDLIPLLNARVVVVSSQYLGNINHSLLTAEALKSRKLPVIGWIFNGTYHVNEEDIVNWSGLKKIGRVEHEEQVDVEIIRKYAGKIGPSLKQLLGESFP
jgi:dethiobiotin synthetase